MLLHVLTQIRARNEALLAHFALIRLLSRMDSFVANQITHLREGAAAHVTLIGLALLVHTSLMLLE